MLGVESKQFTRSTVQEPRKTKLLCVCPQIIQIRILCLGNGATNNGKRRWMSINLIKKIRMIKLMDACLHSFYLFFFLLQHPGYSLYRIVSSTMDKSFQLNIIQILLTELVSGELDLDCPLLRFSLQIILNYIKLTIKTNHNNL